MSRTRRRKKKENGKKLTETKIKKKKKTIEILNHIDIHLACSFYSQNNLIHCLCNNLLSICSLRSSPAAGQRYASNTRIQCDCSARGQHNLCPSVNSDLAKILIDPIRFINLKK